MTTKPITINISTEAYDEINNALKAQGLDTLPDKLTINRDVTIKQPIDFRLATIRYNALQEAVKHEDSGDIIAIANEMFDFIIGKEKTNGWK